MAERSLLQEQIDRVHLTAVAASTHAERAAFFARRALVVATLALIVAAAVVLVR